MRPWIEGLRSRLDDADLDTIITDVPAVTVEEFARWVHERVGQALGSGPDDLAVRVWENPVAFGGYRASSGAPARRPS